MGPIIKFGNTYWCDNETGLPKFDQGSVEQVAEFLQKKPIIGCHILRRQCDRAIFWFLNGQVSRRKGVWHTSYRVFLNLGHNNLENFHRT